MTGALGPRMVLITRETDYEMLVARHATRGQTEFFLRARRQTVDESEQRHLALQAALAELRAGIPRGWRVAQVRRADLDRFLFAPEDVVVAVGQDGLVANVAKYLTGQPVIGVNPEPDRNPGILVPHDVTGAIRLLAPAAAGQAATEERTMLRAELDSGQALLALNEVFVGHASHQSARYVIAQGERSEAQSSSGVIVASGTGATGWALSIGRATGFDVALAPTERAAMFLVREPWPSLATGATIAAGRLGAGERLRVVSRMNEGGVVFADGMEQDRLPFGWGATLSVAVAEQRLRLVASDRKPAAPPQMVRRRTQARVAPPPASAVPVRPVPVPVARAAAPAPKPRGRPVAPRSRRMAAIVLLLVSTAIGLSGLRDLATTGLAIASTADVVYWTGDAWTMVALAVPLAAFAGYLARRFTVRGVALRGVAGLGVLLAVLLAWPVAQLLNDLNASALYAACPSLDRHDDAGERTARAYAAAGRCRQNIN